jgi:hypothetical protein
MRKLSRTAVATALVFAPLVCLSAPLSKIKEISAVSAGVGRLFPEGPETIKIVVKDERPPDPVLIAGLMERALMSAALIAGYSENPRAVAELFEAGAKEAVQILGMKPGEGAVLEITIKDFRIESVTHAFGGLNMIAYGNVQTSLKSADGAELAAKSFRYASWDSSVKLPFQTTYARAAWEAAAKTLQAHFAKKPDPEAVQRVLAIAFDKTRDDAQRTFAIYWLGLVGQDIPSVPEKLFILFRQDKDQTIYETSAVALARLSAPGVREEFEAVVSGSKKLAEWDPKTDAEETWTLLHALAILGGTELGQKIPPTLQRHRERVTDLVHFAETGESPKISPKLSDELTKAKAKKKL